MIMVIIIIIMIMIIIIMGVFSYLLHSCLLTYLPLLHMVVAVQL